MSGGLISPPRILHLRVLVDTGRLPNKMLAILYVPIVRWVINENIN